jgi:hypothetical protein
MIVYSVNADLACDECDESQHFTARSSREVAKAARHEGWFVKGYRSLCPKHKQIQSSYRYLEHVSVP